MLKWRGSIKTIQNVHEWINRCSDLYNSNDSQSEVEIDISKLGRLSPAGCAVLISTLDFLNTYFYLNISVPENEEIISYLERMNFFSVCDEEIRNQFERKIDMERFYNRNRYNQEKNLLEITKCKDPDGVDDLYDSIIKILRDKSVPRDRVMDIANIVSELANNTLEHAECSPYSCIQHYAYPREKVSIAICDTGQGIYKSLKSAVSRRLSPDDVIKEAILTNASRHKGEERGKGLMDVKNRAFNFDEVKFFLRTHDTAYTINEENLIVVSRGDTFFGTYFYLEVRL